MKLFCNLFILSVVDRHLGCLQFLFLQTILFLNILHVQELTQGRGLQSFFFLPWITYNKYILHSDPVHTCISYVCTCRYMEANFSWKNTVLPTNALIFLFYSSLLYFMLKSWSKFAKLISQLSEPWFEKSCSRMHADMELQGHKICVQL